MKECLKKKPDFKKKKKKMKTKRQTEKHPERFIVQDQKRVSKIKCKGKEKTRINSEIFLAGANTSSVIKKRENDGGGWSTMWKFLLCFWIKYPSFSSAWELQSRENRKRKLKLRKCLYSIDNLWRISFSSRSKHKNK